MEGRIGNGKGEAPRVITEARLEQLRPGITQEVRRAYDIASGPHIAYGLIGAETFPVLHPGFQAIDAASSKGEEIPQVIPLPDSLVVGPDGRVVLKPEIAADVNFPGIPEDIQLRVDQVNQAVALREQAAQPQQ